MTFEVLEKNKTQTLYYVCSKDVDALLKLSGQAHIQFLTDTQKPYALKKYDFSGYQAFYLVEKKTKEVIASLVLRDDHLVLSVISCTATNQTHVNYLLKVALENASRQGFLYVGFPTHYRMNKVKLLTKRLNFHISIAPGVRAKRTKDFNTLITELLEQKGKEQGLKRVPAFDSIKPASEKAKALKEWYTYLDKIGEKTARNIQNEIFI